jgi:hypothetical protein
MAVRNGPFDLENPDPELICESPTNVYGFAHTERAAPAKQADVTWV